MSKFVECAKSSALREMSGIKGMCKKRNKGLKSVV